VSACEHTEGNSGNCLRCGRTIPAWYLTEFEARRFYEAIGLPDEFADQAVGRLRAGAETYGWTDYLDRDNVSEGIEEALDLIHYGLFLVLQSYRSGRDAGRAVRAATLAAAAIKELQLDPGH
jgi:hypothetical protein